MNLLYEERENTSHFCDDSGGGGALRKSVTGKRFENYWSFVDFREAANNNMQSDSEEPARYMGRRCGRAHTYSPDEESQG